MNPTVSARALIASGHANARTAADTDWPLISDLYAQLLRRDASPVIALNHAVAVAMADAPRAGLALLSRPNSGQRESTMRGGTFGPDPRGPALEH